MSFPSFVWADSASRLRQSDRVAIVWRDVQANYRSTAVLARLTLLIALRERQEAREGVWSWGKNEVKVKLLCYLMAKNTSVAQKRRPGDFLCKQYIQRGEIEFRERLLKKSRKSNCMI